jgi:hypothetical protein
MQTIDRGSHTMTRCASTSATRAPLFEFLRLARNYPSRACTILKDEVLSYAQMNEISDRLAGALAGLGVEKGDRVGIFMPNLPQFVMAFYAILKAGAVVVASNPQYTPPEIVRQVDDAGVRVMFVTKDLYPTATAAKRSRSCGRSWWLRLAMPRSSSLALQASRARVNGMQDTGGTLTACGPSGPDGQVPARTAACTRSDRTTPPSFSIPVVQPVFPGRRCLHRGVVANAISFEGGLPLWKMPER